MGHDEGTIGRSLAAGDRNRDVTEHFDTIIKEVGRLPDQRIFGRVTNVVGLLIEVSGVEGHLSVGDHCEVISRSKRRLVC